MVDIAADEGLIDAALSTMRLSQCLVQACYPTDSELLQLPYITDDVIQSCTILQEGGRTGRGGRREAKSLAEVQKLKDSQLENALKGLLKANSHDRWFHPKPSLFDFMLFRLGGVCLKRIGGSSSNMLP